MSLDLTVAILAMTSLALAILLLPLLWRRERAAARDAYDLAVYRDQLAEVERDLERGLLGAEEADAARAEIGRRILALAPDAGPTGGTPRAVIATTVAILLLPIAAVLLYWRLGSPALPDQPFAERAAGKTATADAGHSDMAEALGRLAAHLKDHPDDLTGWLLLGRSELGLGHYPAAVEAYQRAVDLSGQRADIVADWGEAQVMAAGGTVTPTARAAFERALMDPENAPRARYYLALAKLQQGDAAEAVSAWRELAAAAPADAAWLPLVRQRIREAEAAAKVGGATLLTPSSAAIDPAVAAAAKAAEGASPEERRAMVDAMVERLAARLATQPDDLEGWSRLGRSYMVLGQPDKARHAYTRALQLKPDDAALRQALADAITAAATATAGAAPAAK